MNVLYKGAIMLIQSQPLDSKFCEKIGLDKIDENAGFTEKEIKDQFIGNMFDDIREKSGKRKISLSLRFHWLYKDIKNLFYDTKYAIRNHFKWRRTISKLRPWEGFSGLISIMITHLNDYIETETLYGHSAEEYKKHKIATAKETVEILKRMEEPDEYTNKPIKEVESHYPKYKGLVTKYVNGGSCFSGDFVAQGNGWVGKESGNNPREGYFEFKQGNFQLTESPDQNETDRLLAQLEKYYEERSNAYEQGHQDSDKDFDCLGQLLKDNLYTWWD